MVGLRETMTGNIDSVIDNTISVENLVKYYRRNPALHGISLEVYPGEVFTIVGPNGSGKTTFMEILEGIRTYTSGRFTVLGGSPRDRVIKEKIGVQLQDSQPMNNLTLIEVLQLFRSFYTSGIRPLEALDSVGMKEKRNAMVRNLSGGEKKRLEIALAIINNPEIIFLDEPTTGLDPNARRQIWAIIRGLKKQRKSVLFTTHYMDEAEALSDRVAILFKGEIVALDTPRRLISESGLQKRIVFSCSSCDTTLVNHFHDTFDHIHRELDTITIQSYRVRQDLADIFSITEMHSVEVEELSVEQPTLEDVFFLKTGASYPAHETGAEETKG